jgi:hypothetical protein
MLFQEDSTPNIFVLVEDRPGRQQLRRVANMDVFWTSGLDPALWPNAVYVNYQASPKAPSEWNPQRDQGPDIVSATELRNLVVFQGEQPAAKRNAAVKAGPNYWIIADGTRRRISNMQVLKPCNSHDNAFNLRRDAHPVSDQAVNAFPQGPTIDSPEDCLRLIAGLKAGNFVVSGLPHYRRP